MALLLKALDKDGDGTISFNEFENWYSRPRRQPVTVGHAASPSEPAPKNPRSQPSLCSSVAAVAPVMPAWLVNCIAV